MGGCGVWWPQALGHVAVPHLYDAISSSSFLVPTSLKVQFKLHTPCSSNGIEIIYIVLIAVLRCFAYH